MLYRALTQPCKFKAKVREEIDEIPHHTLMDSTPINSNGTIYDKPNNNKEVKAMFMLQHFMQPTLVPKFHKTMSVEGWTKAVQINTLYPVVYTLQNTIQQINITILQYVTKFVCLFVVLVLILCHLSICSSVCLYCHSAKMVCTP